MSKEDLVAGTKVFIKKEGLLGKLESRYDGPYTIIRKTEKGNYDLLNSRGMKTEFS